LEWLLLCVGICYPVSVSEYQLIQTDYQYYQFLPVCYICPLGCHHVLACLHTHTHTHTGQGTL